MNNKKETKIIIERTELGKRYRLTAYLNRIDHTHFGLTFDKDRPGTPYHVGQVKDEPYYQDICDWLDGTKDIDGNAYDYDKLKPKNA